MSQKYLNCDLFQWTAFKVGISLPNAAILLYIMISCGGGGLLASSAWQFVFCLLHYNALP